MSRLALPAYMRRPRPRQHRTRVEPKPFQLGAQLSSNSLTFVPAEAVIRPLADWLVIEPIDIVFSKYLFIPQGQPIRGICRAAGPGVYPRQYDHVEKHKRTKTWHGTVFRPTETQVGDTLWFGGLERSYPFEQFWHGESLRVWCRDEDVCLIEGEDA